VIRVKLRSQNSLLYGAQSNATADKSQTPFIKIILPSYLNNVLPSPPFEPSRRTKSRRPPTFRILALNPHAETPNPAQISEIPPRPAAPAADPEASVERAATKKINRRVAFTGLPDFV
jgi:hypothetical protein